MVVEEEEEGRGFGGDGPRDGAVGGIWVYKGSLWFAEPASPEYEYWILQGFSV